MFQIKHRTRPKSTKNIKIDTVLIFKIQDDGVFSPQCHFNKIKIKNYAKKSQRLKNVKNQIKKKYNHQKNT